MVDRLMTNITLDTAFPAVAARVAWYGNKLERAMKLVDEDIDTKSDKRYYVIDGKKVSAETFEAMFADSFDMDNEIYAFMYMFNVDRAVMLNEDTTMSVYKAAAKMYFSCDEFFDYVETYENYVNSLDAPYCEAMSAL